MIMMVHHAMLPARAHLAKTHFKITKNITLNQ
jgi:hypothetical protein